MQSFKVTLVGDAGVGKTNLTDVFHGSEFKNNVTDPVPHNKSSTVTILNKEYNLVVTDTRGSNDFDKLRPLGYPNTDTFIICFSVVSPRSFANIKAKWIPELTKYCPGRPFIIIGTKSDLRNDENTLQLLQANNESPITQQQAEKLVAEECTDSFYWECSAFENFGLENVFHQALSSAIENIMFTPEGWVPVPRRNAMCVML